MHDLHATTIVQSEYHDALTTLQALNRDLDTPYRLGVGRYILQRFFGGQAAAYASRDHNKDTKFKDFVGTCADDLAELDLSESTLRRYVRGHICHSQLPPGPRERLRWGSLLALAAVEEPNLRARLATAAVHQQWSLGQLKAAVAQAQQNRLWDADPSTPELELPEPGQTAEPAPQPARLVTQTEKWADEIAAWRERYARIDRTRLSEQQVTRMRWAVKELRGELDALEHALPR